MISGVIKLICLKLRQIIEAKFGDNLFKRNNRLLKYQKHLIVIVTSVLCMRACVFSDANSWTKGSLLPWVTLTLYAVSTIWTQFLKYSEYESYQLSLMKPNKTDLVRLWLDYQITNLDDWNVDTAICAKPIRPAIVSMCSFHSVMGFFHLIMHSLSAFFSSGCVLFSFGHVFFSFDFGLFPFDYLLFSFGFVLFPFHYMMLRYVSLIHVKLK